MSLTSCKLNLLTTGLLIITTLFMSAGAAVAGAPTPPVILSPSSHIVSTCPLTLTWSSSETGTGIAGYSFLIDGNSSTIVDTVSEGLITETTYSNLAKGTYYFHVAAVDNTDNWSPTTHFQIIVTKTAFLVNDFNKGDESTPIILNLVPLFESMGVDLYINGHNHFYQRAYKNGVYYLTPGSGGSPLHTPFPGGDSNSPYVQFTKKTFGHAVITTGTDKITVTDYDMANNINDTFNIKKPGANNDPLPLGETITAPAGAGNIMPYLQDVTQTGIKVMWLSSLAENSRVDYGLTAAYGLAAEDPAAVTVHKITLTGLQPGTLYHYKVTSGANPGTTDAVFRTAPADDSGFTFIAYGDSRPREYGPTPAPDHAAVCASIAAHNPGTLILDTGDVTNDASQDQWIPNFFNPARDILKNNAVYMTVGNHEMRNIDFFDAYFYPPQTGGSGSNRYYSFNYGNTHFIVLDEYEDYTVGSAQYDWLISDLDSSPAKNAAWRIVLAHRPVYHTYSRDLQNNYGGNTYSFQRSGDGSYAYISYEIDPEIALGGTGTSVKIDYSLPPSGWSGMIVELENADLRDYNAVSFWVKGGAGGEIFKAGLKDSVAGGPDEVNVTDYANITTSWQKVTIPFTAFTAVETWDNMIQFTLAFTDSLDASGRIYVDNISFEKIDPPAFTSIMIDNYNDGDLGRNSLGFWTGGTSLMPDGMESSFNGSPCRKINYISGTWYASNLGNGTTPMDITGYDYLAFDVKSGSGGGSLTLELQYGASSVTHAEFNNISPEWRNVIVPLSSFAGLDKNSLRAVSMVFHEPGVIYLDNLRFVSDNVLEVEPGLPIKAAIEGAIKDTTVALRSGVYVEDINVEGKDSLAICGEPDDYMVLRGNIIIKNSSVEIKDILLEYKEGALKSYSDSYYEDLGFFDDAGITAINSEVTVKGCIIRPDPDVFGEDRFGKGIQMLNLYRSGNTSPLIEGNEISNSETAIYFYSQVFGGAINGTIGDNILENNKYGIVLRMHKEEPVIDGNTISTSAEDAIHITYTDASLLANRLVNISNNHFIGNARDVFCDELGSVVVPTGPGNIYE